jgi:hypothetical protein
VLSKDLIPASLASGTAPERDWLDKVAGWAQKELRAFVKAPQCWAAYIYRGGRIRAIYQFSFYPGVAFPGNEISILRFGNKKTPSQLFAQNLDTGKRLTRVFQR